MKNLRLLLFIFTILIISCNNSINKRSQNSEVATIDLNGITDSENNNKKSNLSDLFVNNNYIITENSNSRKALIIANGIYQEETRWSNISSHNDIDIITNALKNQGFLGQNIQIEKDLTSKNLLNILNSFIAKLNEGDIVYVHFSGHGQQIYDDNKDEKDGYDEAIIPVDAPGDYRRNGYTGDKHIRDEKLGDIFDQIRKKIGVNGNLFATIDACHSGTGTRGLTKVRGTVKPFEPEDYEPVNTSSINDYGLLNNSENLASAVYFYGSSANELNYEYEVENGKYVGSLSYAFSKALTEASKNTTYQGLFDNVKRIMAIIAPKQSPQAEGVLNQKILGGQLVGKKEYFLVTEYQNKNNNTYVRLNGGTLHGLHKGSKVAFYDIDDLNTKNIKTTGIVIKADVINSQIKLDKTIGENDAKNSWITITERNYGDLNVDVSISLKSKELQGELKSMIDSIGFIRLNSKSPDLIIENWRGSHLQVYTKNDYVFWESNALYGDDTNLVIATEIIEVIKEYVRVNFIRGLEMQNEELNVSFDFVPLLMKDDGMDRIIDKELSIESKKNASGTIIFNEGDYTYVKVKNNSKKTLYYTLLDIQPDNIINVLIPDQNATANDYYLKPGEEYKHQIEFYPPYGTEMFKLIASEEPLDLRTILTNRGMRSKGETRSNPFELLFEDSFKSDVRGTRGVGTINIPSGAVNILTTTFEIKE